MARCTSIRAWPRSSTSSRPTSIVEDNVVGFPALAASGRPWVRIASCNPAEIKDPAVPPFSSGYPGRATGGDWPAFLEEVERTHRDMWEEFDTFSREHGDTGLSYGPYGPDLISESPWLNLYSYPAEADYARERPLGPTWHRLDSTVRAADATWDLPEHLRNRDGALIYLSLGSPRFGGRGADAAPGRPAGHDRAPGHRLEGPAGRPDHPPRQPGGRGLPAPAGDPAGVDLVITHGGNNTVTEAFHHGKPMIVLPLFWDQVDNAQRIDETGFGRRLATYDFRDEELTDAIDELLADGPLARRLIAMSERIKATKGTVRAADLIERVARTGEPVLAG